MPDLTARVGRRTGRETFVSFRFRTEFEAKRVWRVLNALSEAGQLDSRSYVVVCMCVSHGIEMLLALAVGSDHDAQIDAIVAACRERLSINVRSREMSPNDYEPHALLARVARSQDN